MTDVVLADMEHTWVGDLTIKLQQPAAGPIFGVMSRPGLADVGDNGLDCCGSSSDILPATGQIPFDDAAATTSENIGAVNPISATPVQPSKGSIVSPYTTFASLAASFADAAAANGTWTLGIGDGGATDIGQFTSWTLEITYAAPAVPCELVCPADLFVNLDPGACDAILNFNDPEQLGDCVFTVEVPGSITQNLNTTIIEDALDCAAGLPTSQWRAYDLTAMGVQGDFTLQSVLMGGFFAGTVQIFAYTYTHPAFCDT